MTRTIALIGAGAMGGAIGARLLATGARLVVFDPDPAKNARLWSPRAPPRRPALPRPPARPKR